MSQQPIPSDAFIVRSLSNYQLRARLIQPQGGGHCCLEFEQLWPEAQHPHWRRVAQFNLSREELRDFAQYLLVVAGESA